MDPLSKRLNKLFDADDYSQAERILRAALIKDPNDHWLLTCLGATLYEQHKYKRALAWHKKAYKLEPKCPLVLWNIAGTLFMLDRDVEAKAMYQNLLRRGVKRLANGRCGEGLRWAKRFIADCRIRLQEINKPI